LAVLAVCNNNKIQHQQQSQRRKWRHGQQKKEKWRAHGKAMRRMALSVLWGVGTRGDGEEGKRGCALPTLVCGRIEMDLGERGENCGYGSKQTEKEASRRQFRGLKRHNGEAHICASSC
jgi:hypothetical protein